jgi:hypothetical protein
MVSPVPAIRITDLALFPHGCFPFRIVHQNRDEEKNASAFFDFRSVRQLHNYSRTLIETNC